ncbi:hypothetical protein K5D38_11335 [Pseudomonas cichorii]|nr:hypothetical protein [Pseudomonas cichorii]
MSMNNFKRENRYIVIKRKDLSAAPFAALHSFLEHLQALEDLLPVRQFVVVESDWPEYEPVWQMIERRVSGSSTMSDELKPCPSCGQQEAFVEQLDSDASVVICQGRVGKHSACLARGPVGVQESDNESQPGYAAAVREWNQSAASKLRALGEEPEVFYMLRNTEIRSPWRDADKAAFDSAAGLCTYERRELVDRKHVAKLQADVERLRYKAELYDEVWSLATGMGFLNVTTALDTLKREQDATKARNVELEGLLREMRDPCVEASIEYTDGFEAWVERIDAALVEGKEHE